MLDVNVITRVPSVSSLKTLTTLLKCAKAVRKITSYNTNTRVIKRVYGNCHPLQICKGPADTLLLLDKYSGVLKLEWVKEKEDLRRKSTKAINVCGLTINAMSYIESLDLLVFTAKSPSCASAFCLGTGSRQWEIKDEVLGLNADFLGNCCDPAGYIFVWNGQNNKIFVLDGQNKGKIEQEIVREEITGKIIAACWTTAQEQLTVLSVDKDGATISCFSPSNNKSR